MTQTQPLQVETPVRRILVTAYGHIADVLPSLPALRALRESYPEAHITVMAVEYVREMFEASPYVDRVLILKDFTHKGTRRGMLEQVMRLAQLAPRLYRQFDVVLVLHARTRFLARVARLTGAPVRAGFADTAPAGVFTHAARPLAVLASFREENRRVLEAIGIHGMRQNLELEPSAADTMAVSAMLAAGGISEDDLLIGLHPGSHWTCQQWRLEDWAELADQIVERYGARLVITGTKDEHGLATGIRERMHRRDAVVMDATGRTTITEFAALVKRLRLLVCVNSAASQVALAVGTRSINLVGFENPVWTAPLRSEPMTIVRGCDDTTAQESWCPYGVWGKLSSCHRSECVGIGGLDLIGVHRALTAVSAAMRSTGIQPSLTHQLSTSIELPSPG